MSSCCDKTTSTDNIMAEKFTWNKVLRNIFSSDAKWIAERQLLLYTVSTIFLLLAVLFIMHITIFSKINNFLNSHLVLLILWAPSAAIISGVWYHFKAYNRPLSCEMGMMEGMTFGMMGGFIIGALVGATNGMFWGCVIGMLVPSVIGIWAGKKCGVMGFMEGLMGGIMGGTMGAMISVMLLADPLPLFLALLIGLCLICIIATVYMRIVEYGQLSKNKNIQIEGMTSVASTAFILFLLITLFMVYGPKSGPVWGMI